MLTEMMTLCNFQRDVSGAFAISLARSAFGYRSIHPSIHPYIGSYHHGVFDISKPSLLLGQHARNLTIPPPRLATRIRARRDDAHGPARRTKQHLASRLIVPEPHAPLGLHVSKLLLLLRGSNNLMNDQPLPIRQHAPHVAQGADARPHAVERHSRKVDLVVALRELGRVDALAVPPPALLNGRAIEPLAQHVDQHFRALRRQPGL